MATISENLQIIKNSTDAIKQAIIDKGGDIQGDITTWADAINGISGGGGDTQYTFRGLVSANMMTININGILESKPTNGNAVYFCALGFGQGGIVMASTSVTMSNSVSLSLNMREPLNGVSNINFILIESNYNGFSNIHKLTYVEDTSFGGGTN